MPADVFGVKKIHPDSTLKSMTWFAADAENDPRALLSGTLTAVKKNDNIYTFEGNEAAKLNILTTSGYKPSLIEYNHSAAAARGFLQDGRDWVNIEATTYLYVESDSEDTFYFMFRGGKQNSFNNGCEGFAYLVELFYTGHLRIAKKQYHVSYAFGDKKQVMGSIEAKWIGIKACIYNNDANNMVTIDVYLDRNADGNWTKEMTFVDKGGFGSSGARCGGKPDQIGTWGGPIVTMGWDNADIFEMKSMSVREIDPYGEFTDGGGGTGMRGGSGESFSGQAGVGGIIVCTDNPVQSGGQYAAGDASKTLYKLTGRTQNAVDTGYKTRHYSSGKPNTVTREWNFANCLFANLEITMYTNVGDPDDYDDLISTKITGGPAHNSDGQGWYIHDIRYKDGLSGWGREHTHSPQDTEAFTDVGMTVGSIINRKIGNKIVSWRKGSGAHCESWFDGGDKVWRKTTTVDNPDGKQYPVHNPQHVQVRIDAAPNITMYGLTLKEIEPGGVFVGSGGSGGGGGQTCREDPDEYMPPLDPVDDTFGMPSGSAGGNTNEKKPLMTLAREWTFIHNVGVDTEDNCTAGNPLEEKEPQSIYAVQGEEGQYRDLGYQFYKTNGATQLGVYINKKESVLFGVVPRKIVINGIKRTLDALSEASTGLLRCQIIKAATKEIQRQFGNTVNVNGIDVNDQPLEFLQLDNKYRLVVGDMIVFSYYSLDANTDKCLKIKCTTKDTIDGVNSYMIAWEYSGYEGYWDKDLGISVFE